MGALALFRAHASQMFLETRSAVEVAGIAFTIMHDKDALAVLLDDLGSEEQRKAVINRFKRTQIFPKDKEVFTKLKEHYEYCSMRAHTNMAALLSHFAKVGDNPY